MKGFCALILTAVLLLNEGYVANSVPWSKGRSTTASELAHILVTVAAPCTFKQTNCKNPALDIVFALDSSSSIDDTEFKVQKYATQLIAEFIDKHGLIAPDGTRVGALTFSTDVVREFELNEYTDLATIKAYIDAIDNRVGATNIKLALETAQLMFEDFFLEESQKIIWLLADRVYNLGDPRPRATSMKKQGWIICVVVIGNHGNVDEIADIASPGCAVKFGSFTEYAKVAKEAQGLDHKNIIA
ncbi:uncharacterized protein LOC106180460 [Lingula anatina]|uniref:Uncharacterized protein LOC106180460 n=1 Tax=Lingula anatina TaxID=7574 RepID=A0A1S3KCB5_LINAN|nr:uncharacterized protein LOC106180460 [Lingula anatina]|eukprot:XP_013419901.1 uncharacterized protein LOC106180460 [Lingula anatina]